MKRAILGLLVLGVFLWANPGIGAEDVYVVATGGRVGTAIPSLPYTITNPGFYYLRMNLTYSGTGKALTIDADGVTLDLMGFCLSGSGTSSGDVIYISGNNVEVRNGYVKNSYYGLHNEIVNQVPNHNHRFVNLMVSNCVTGIEDHADEVIITGCQVSENTDTGIYSTAKCGIIDQNTVRGNDSEGFALPDFAGVLTNNAAYANGVGFTLSDSSATLVDRNASFQNVTSNWVGLNNCTQGLNTP